METNRPGWSAVLRGETSDIEDWICVLSAAFDPWTETYGNETILRSSSFNELGTADDVRARAMDMIDYLNGAIALSQDAGPVSFGGTIQFDSEGHAHRTMFAEMGAFEVKDKMRAAGYPSDANGNPIPAVPAPSEVQEWAAIADNDILIQEALTYFRKSQTWFNIYKALECLMLRFGGDEAKFLALEWDSPAQVKLIKRSANALRHAKNRFEPIENPMTLREANSLLSKLLRRALREAQAKPTR